LPLKRPWWNERFIENEKRGIVEYSFCDKIIRDMDQELVSDFEVGVKCCSVCKRPMEEHTDEQLMECLSRESMKIGVF